MKDEEKSLLLNDELAENEAGSELGSKRDGADVEASHSTSAGSQRLKNTSKLARVTLWALGILGCLAWYGWETPSDRHVQAYLTSGASLGSENWEKLFLSVPNNESCLAASRSYTGFAHIAGKKGDFETAVLVRNQWEKSLGLQVSKSKEKLHDAGSKASRKLLKGSSDKVRVWTDTYYVLLNHPAPLSRTKTALSMHDAQGNTIFKAQLAEAALEQDPTSKHGNKDVPPFHGYSHAGTAEGQLVYAHFGTVEDFARLKANGVDVTGKIVMVRYGGNFRGLKVKASQDAGAAGVIIYSDPGEDGDITTEKGYLPYPQGPARNPTSLQRGSVQYLSSYPGDPTTPDRPSYKGVKREEPTNLPGIPSLPLSYGDALPLLKQLNGRGPCFEDWKGGLGYQGVSYCSGPSEHNVTLTNDVDSDIWPIWNTYAVIPGHTTEEVVLVGNHRDAWVFGASDPNSGTASVHEIVRGLGELLKKGWKPLRTIVIASWDAEEYGLVGSTEFGEDYAQWAEKVVAYLNVDGSVSGSNYAVQASPSLADLFVNVSQATVPSEDTRNMKVGTFGSGSDFTVFLQHLGIASVNLGYKSTHKDPVYHYHSIYDSEAWMERYGDPGFHRHVSVAKALGLATLRLADTLVSPLNITRYADQLDQYLSTVKATAERLNFTDVSFDGVAKEIENIKKNALTLDEEMSHLDRDQCKLSAKERGRKHRKRHRRRHGKHIKHAIDINKRKRHFEKSFISKEGLPRRTWYKHLAVAPGENLGYGATTFPGVTEAMTITNSKEVLNAELARLVRQLRKVARGLERRGTRGPRKHNCRKE